MLYEYSCFEKDYRIYNDEEKLEDLCDIDAEAEPDVQFEALVNKYMQEPHTYVENAKENLKLIQELCDTYAKQHQGYVKSTVSLLHYTAKVTLQLPMMILGKEEFDVLDTFKDKIKGVVIIPSGSSVRFSFSVHFFYGR